MLINLMNYNVWDKSLINDSVPIIITTYHKKETFKQCFLTLSKHNKNPIYIIDNSCGKIDDLLENIKSYDNTTIIKNDKNLGKATSIQNNYKDIILKYQWFISMDPDIIISAKDIQKLLDDANYLINKNYPISMMSPIINDGHSKLEQLSNESLDMHKWGNMYSIGNNWFINEYLAGCVLLINTLFFVKNGGFTNLQLYGGDDGELCKNSIKNNMISVLNANIECKHCRDEETEEYQNWKLNNIRDKQIQKGFWDL